MTLVKTKVCSGCRKELSLDTFKKGRHYALGYRANCRSCDNERRRAYLAKHPYKRKNRITAETYARLFAEQGGLCAICKEPERGLDLRYNKVRALAMDHDHESNEKRGLLCASCNLGLGKFRDKPQILRNAIQYLAQYGKF